MIKKANQLAKFYLVLISGIILFPTTALAQNNLQHYLDAAIQNNPALKENTNLLRINELNKSLNESQYSLPQISLTSNYLFAPYFNNSGGIISTNPDPNAIGYDIGLTNGGLYSAQVNVTKNIFNGAVIDALYNQRRIQEELITNNSDLLKRELIKQVTDQYLQTYLSLKLFGITKELSSYLKEQMKILGELVESGMAKQSEYLLLSIENENQNIAANNYYSQYKTNLMQLNTLCGISDSSVVMIDSVFLQTKEEFRQSELFKKYELDSLALQN